MAALRLPTPSPRLRRIAEAASLCFGVGCGESVSPTDSGSADEAMDSIESGFANDTADTGDSGGATETGIDTGDTGDTGDTAEAPPAVPPESLTIVTTNGDVLRWDAGASAPTALANLGVAAEVHRGETGLLNVADGSGAWFDVDPSTGATGASYPGSTFGYVDCGGSAWSVGEDFRSVEQRDSSGLQTSVSIAVADDGDVGAAIGMRRAVAATDGTLYVGWCSEYRAWTCGVVTISCAEATAAVGPRVSQLHTLQMDHGMLVGLAADVDNNVGEIAILSVPDLVSQPESRALGAILAWSGRPGLPQFARYAKDWVPTVGSWTGDGAVVQAPDLPIEDAPANLVVLYEAGVPVQAYAVREGGHLAAWALSPDGDGWAWSLLAVPDVGPIRFVDTLEP